MATVLVRSIGRLMVVVAVLMAAAPVRGDGAEEVWGIKKGETGVVRGVVWVPGMDEAVSAADRCDGLKTASLMYRRVRGVVGVIEGRELRLLAAATGSGAANAFEPAAWQRMFTVWVCADSGQRRKVSLVQTPDGNFWAEALDEQGKSLAIGRVEREKLLPIAADWGEGRAEEAPVVYAGGFDGPSPVEPGRSEVLGQPYVPGAVVLEQEVLEDRFLRGKTTRLPRLDRVLRIENLWVRPPKGYSAKEPAGLVVWVNAGEEGKPPEVMFDTLDAMNFVVAGFDKCGNARPFTNRAQLTLDAVATVGRRFHIDPRRVYIAGVSGGGRVAGMMAICFPDVFTGCLSFVGLSGFEPVSLPGGQRAAATFAKPPGKILEMLRGHRIAAVTGAKDMNRGGVTATAQSLRAAGLDVKTFEYEDMGHTLPTAERFREQLAWVDEPYQNVRQKEVEAAERELKKFGELTKLDRPVNAQERSALNRVMELGPWTPAAWRAQHMADAANERKRSGVR